MKTNNPRICYEDGQWFLGGGEGGYPISYVYFICYALHSYLHSEYPFTDESNQKESKIVQQKVKSLLEEAIMHLKQQQSFYKPAFLEIYYFEAFNNKHGVLIIDRSNGCYPLVFYPKDDSHNHKARIPACVKSFETVCDNFSEIWDVIILNSVWDENMQKKLEEFDYKPS